MHWLAPLSSIDAVLSTLLDVLGEHEQATSAIKSQVFAALSERHMLLLLDNAEHLRELPSLLAELVAHCPHLTLLVTSRRPLRIYGEQEFELRPFPLPPKVYPLRHSVERAEEAPVADQDISELQRNPAVALFVERAHMIQPGFRFSADNAQTILDICTFLDGLPLALELAAGCIRLLTIQEILHRLQHRQQILVHGQATAQQHHFTLQDAWNWSYQLLTPPEASCLRLLSRFAGGCPLDQLSQLLALVAHPTEATTIPQGDSEASAFDIVLSLCEQHLIQRYDAPDGTPRLTMLTTLREFAWHQVEVNAETEAIAHIHVGYVRDLIDAASPHLWGANQAQWIDRLEHDRANIRVALDWAIPHEPVLGLYIVGKLFRFWRVRNLLNEGRSYLNWALATIPPDNQGLYAKALNGAGLLALQQGDFAQAVQRLKECLKYQRHLPDWRGLGGALTNLALVYKDQGQFQEAQQYQEEALTLYLTMHSERDVAVALNNLGNIRRIQGDYQEAARLQEDALTIHRERGDTYAIAMVLGNLGVLASVQGALERASRYFQETLALHQELGNRFEVALTQLNLGENAYLQGNATQGNERMEQCIAYFRFTGALPSLAAALTVLGNGFVLQGNYAKARVAYQEALDVYSKLGFPYRSYQSFLGYAHLLHLEGAQTDAVHWLGVLHHWCEQHRIQLEPAEQRLRDHLLQVSQAVVPAQQWHALWEQGIAAQVDTLYP